MYFSPYFENLSDDKIKCTVCLYECILAPNQYGICKVRKNQDGKIVTETYNMLTALLVDPIEKKPIFHVYPGEDILSFATKGCNFICPWCQNYQISQFPRQYQTRPLEAKSTTAQEIAVQAIFLKTPMIAATYTEPTIFAEYAFDVAKISKTYDILNIWVTNGSFGKGIINEIPKYIDALNIDLKYLGKLPSQFGNFMPNPDKILENIEFLHKKGVWIELTTLVVTGFNDDFDLLKNIAAKIASISKNIPWHLSGYYPAFKHNRPPTQGKTLLKATDIAKEAGLNFVYTGNINTQNSEDTLCPTCQKPLIKRKRYTIIENLIKKGGICPYCSTKIPGIFR